MADVQLSRRIKNHLKYFRAVARYRKTLKKKASDAQKIAQSDYTLPFIEMRITTRCNMKCKKCGHFIPCYGKTAKDISFEEFKLQFDKLVNAVSYIEVFSLVGGETLIADNINEIAEYVLKCDKIGEIHLVSNGKLLPSCELLTLLSGTRARLCFSIYPQNLDNYKEIERLCKRYDVNYEFYGDMESGKQVWLDYGAVKKHHISKINLVYMADTCFFGNAKQYCNGMLFLCPRISNAYDLGLIDLPDNELFKVSDDIIETRENIRNFYSLPYSYGCKFCKAHRSLKINAAEQI